MHLSELNGEMGKNDEYFCARLYTHTPITHIHTVKNMFGLYFFLIFLLLQNW